jgi:hypothetical protein
LDAALWGAVLIGAIVVLALAVWLIKRRLFSTVPRDEQIDVMSLQQLRNMLSEGQITKDEFDKLKRAALDSARHMPTGKSGGAPPATGENGGAKAVK